MPALAGSKACRADSIADIEVAATVQMISVLPEPPLDREQDALNWAIDEFQRNAHNLRLGGVVDERAAWFEKVLRAGAAFRGEIAVGDAEYDRAADYVEYARHGDKLGRKVSLELAAALIERGETLTGPLREFIVEFLRKPKEPKRSVGRQTSEHLHRNLVIGYVIATIVLRSKFPATRNDATKGKRASAASIARAALEKAADIKLKEEAVNKIWAGSVFRTDTQTVARWRQPVGKKGGD